MKNNDNDLVSSCLNMCLIMQILSWEIKWHISEKKYRIQHDFSNLNKAIKMIEQSSVLSSEEQSLIDRVWSLIVVNIIL